MQLEVTRSMEISTLTLSFRTLSLLDNSMSLKKTHLHSNARRTSRSGSKSPCAERKCEQEIPIISLNEVSWHDTINDCWLVIRDYVYNCTEFVHDHPGSQEVLLEYAGRDATLAFVGTGHSQYAKTLLKKFLVGELPVSERIFRAENGMKIGDFV